MTSQIPPSSIEVGGRQWILDYKDVKDEGGYSLGYVLPGAENYYLEISYGTKEFVEERASRFTVMDFFAERTSGSCLIEKLVDDRQNNWASWKLDFKNAPGGESTIVVATEPARIGKIVCTLRVRDEYRLQFKDLWKLVRLAKSLLRTHFEQEIDLLGVEGGAAVNFTENPRMKSSKTITVALEEFTGPEDLCDSFLNSIAIASENRTAENAAALQDLAEVIVELSKYLREEEQYLAAKNLSTLLSQTTATDPQFSVIEQSGNELIKIAKPIQYAAEPVKIGVEEVLKLFR